jgi:hypothetical protein
LGLLIPLKDATSSDRSSTCIFEGSGSIIMILSFGVQFYVAVVCLEKKLKLEVVRTEFLSFSFSALALNSCDLITSLFSIASVFITEEFANACAILNKQLKALILFTIIHGHEN